MDTRSLFMQRLSGPEHTTFLWEGGAPAVLLIHGFPSTPAELRPLAQHFHDAGWTAQGLLLPGFGPEIGALFQCKHSDWVKATSVALTALRREHQPVVLLGHSMGGAVALCAAAKTPPDGLILLAPFRRFGFQTPVFRLLWPLLRRIIRQIRPFSRLDLQSRDVRFAVRQFLPDMDLDDPAALAELRKFSLPPCIFEDLRRVGEASYTAASHVTAPTLVLQGLQDGLVASRGTRALVSRIPGPLTYREIEGPHELLDPHAVSWPTVTAAVLDFATGLTMQSTVPARSVAG